MAKTPARRTAPRIAVVDGQPTTTSRDIAETFGKRHDDVLKRIRSLDCSPEFTARNFAASEYTDPTGRTLTEYRITRDGFAFLCMGFTGQKAAQWKERYIDTFNKMAQKLAAQTAPAQHSALDAPANADVRALALAGLPQAVPLCREVQALVNRRAWTLAHEAYELMREHLERLVAARTTPAMREPGASQVAQLVQGVTLDSALAHAAHTADREAMRVLRVSVDCINDTLARVQAARAGLPPEPMP